MSLSKTLCISSCAPPYRSSKISTAISLILPSDSRQTLISVLVYQYEQIFHNTNSHLGQGHPTSSDLNFTDTFFNASHCFHCVSLQRPPSVTGPLATNTPVANAPLPLLTACPLDHPSSALGTKARLSQTFHSKPRTCFGPSPTIYVPIIPQFPNKHTHTP